MARGRKVRSDKKVDVKPLLPIELKRHLYEFCFLTNEHVKDVAEKLCVDGLESRFIIEPLRENFRRDYICKPSVIIGNPDVQKMDTSFRGRGSKITIKFKQPHYDRLCELAYAMDLTPTTTASVLICECLLDKEFMKQYVEHQVQHLEPHEINSLHTFLSI